MIRYALIGAGMMGQEHIQNIRLLPDSEVACIADPDTDMLDQATSLASNSCRGYRSHHELVQSESFDALIIASPNHTHFPILADLVTSSVPILVEKPLCLNTKQCDESIRSLAGRSAPVWVAMEYRYKPPVTQLIERVQSGAVGRPVMINIQEHRYPFLKKVGDWNRFNRNTGGTLVEKCCHFFDLFALLAQAQPTRVYATAGMSVNHLDESYEGEQPDILDNAFVCVDFANGVRAMLDLCMFAEGVIWQEKIRVTGDCGGIEVELPGPPPFAPNSIDKEAVLSLFPRDGKLIDQKVISVDQALLEAGHHHGATFFQHQKFQQLVIEGGEPEVSLNDGRLAVAIGEAAQEAALTGRAIEL